MFAYVVTASFSEYGDKEFGMLVYHNGSRREVEAQVARDGWKVKRVRAATMDDISDVSRYDEVLLHVKAEVQHKQIVDADNLKRAEAEKKQRAEQHKREEDARQKEEACRQKVAEENHDLAIFKAAGDLFGARLERELMGNVKIASLCAKTLLFFNQASLNRKDLFTAISIDFADFQSQSSCPVANRLLGKLLNELNEFLKIDEGIKDIEQRVFADRVSVENQVNAIGSRTHIYGGSGAGLLFSFLAAHSDANEDSNAIQSIQNEHVRQAREAQRAVGQAGLRQQLLEYRAKAAVSMLLAACGKSDTIEMNMSPMVEEYVLESVDKE